MGEPVRRLYCRFVARVLTVAGVWRQFRKGWRCCATYAGYEISSREAGLTPQAEESGL